MLKARRTFFLLLELVIFPHGFLLFGSHPVKRNYCAQLAHDADSSNGNLQYLHLPTGQTAYLNYTMGPQVIAVVMTMDSTILFNTEIGYGSAVTLLSGSTNYFALCIATKCDTLFYCNQFSNQINIE